MLEAFLLSLSCVLVTDLVEYKDGAYHSTKVIECPAEVKLQVPYLTEASNDEVKHTLLSINLNKGKLLITNDLEVNRPWIAPQPLFMEIAKVKHKDKLAEELRKLLK